MKKGYILLAVIAMAAVAVPASAQQLRFGVEAGATVNTSTWKMSDGYKTKGLGGYNVGVRLEAEIYDNVWLQSGLVFCTKGAESKLPGQPTSWNPAVMQYVTNSYRPMYLQVPVLLAYKFEITPRFRLFGAAGGFVAQGLTGEYKKETVYSKDVQHNDQNTSVSKSPFSGGALKRFDAGLSLGGGIEFGRLVLRVTYDWSMLNIAKDVKEIGTDDFKNRSLSIAAGFRF